MKLIFNWRDAWKMVSIQANSIGIAICTTYAAMYDQLKDAFPPQYMFALTGAVFVLGIIARVTHQPALHQQVVTPIEGPK